MKKGKTDVSNTSAAFRIGVISLVFMVIGFQVALFVHRAAVLDIVSHRDSPDTVVIYVDRSSDAPVGQTCDTVRQTSVSVGQTSAPVRKASHSPLAGEAYERFAPRKVQSFRFNPNTLPLDSLKLLGFSDKQAAAIVKYRESGGRFRRKSDFARSFVVADSIYRRLEDFIEIPLVDINKADSSLFDTLPGIGPYFASRMVSYRNELGGYSFPEQLMDIYRFDREKYDALEDLICCNPEDAAPFGLWVLPADSLRLHPYVRNWNTAKAIVLFRENTPAQEHTAASLASAGIIDPETAAKLARINTVVEP